jgi:thymidine kinase
MFPEYSDNITKRRGWIEVICGAMFSGKTEELIRRVRRAEIAKQKVEIFKPEIDNRYDLLNVVSHDANKIVSTPVSSASQIMLMVGAIDVIGIDEAQFFDEELPNVCKTLADRGIRIIVAGLDMDFNGKPFGPMPQLLATAEYVTKIHAICVNCGELASYTYRKSDAKEKIILGAHDNYSALCRTCFNKEMNTK